MPPTKLQSLRASGTFNPRAAQVRHPLFVPGDFFDPRDLVQLKYETLRALQKDDYSIVQAATQFGLSRPTIYEAQAHFQTHGLEGLLPRKRGPKNPHKLSGPVRQYLDQVRLQQPALKPAELARRIRERFDIQVHPRTIEKALHAKEKKGRSTL